MNSELTPNGPSQPGIAGHLERSRAISGNLGARASRGSRVISALNAAGDLGRSPPISADLRASTRRASRRTRKTCQRQAARVCRRSARRPTARCCAPPVHRCRCEETLFTAEASTRCAPHRHPTSTRVEGPYLVSLGLGTGSVGYCTPSARGRPGPPAPRYTPAPPAERPGPARGRVWSGRG